MNSEGRPGPADPSWSGASRRQAGVVLTLVLAGLSMLGPFTIDAVFPAFSAMSRDFDAGPVEMQQVTSVYLFFLAVMSIFHGPISDAVGRRPVIVVGLVGYIAATALCALAPTLEVLLVGRALQGTFGGAGTIVSRAVVRDMFDGPQAQQVMAHIMMLFSLAPAVAPVLTGLALGFGPWPIVFWGVAGYAAVLILATVTVIPETLPPPARTPLRVKAVLGSIWAVARSWRFERLSLATAMVFSGHFLYVAAAPIFMVDVLGLGERDFWMLFVPMIAGMIVGSWISARVAHRVSRGRLVAYALVATLVAAVVNLGMALVAPSLPWAVAGPGLVAVGASVVFPVLQLELMDQFPHHRGAAASMGTFLSLGFNAVVAGVMAPFVTGSVAQVALACLGFVVLGALLYWWHVQATRQR